MRLLKRQGIVWGVLLLAAAAFPAVQAGKPGAPLGPGENNPRLRPARQIFASSPGEVAPLARFVQRQIDTGSLRLLSAKDEKVDGVAYRHERFDEYFRGVKVWGGQLIRHTRDGLVYTINGSWYDKIGIDVAPLVEPERAALMARQALTGSKDVELYGTPELLVYPEETTYRLAWLVVLLRPASEMFVFVDAKTGAAFLQYDNLKTESTEIGKGTGTFGDTKKLSVTKKDDGKYYLIDGMRPAVLVTGNHYNSNNYSPTYYCTDTDNDWTDDATMVDAHAYLGWMYDYYYRVFERKGMDDNDMQHVACVHYGRLNVPAERDNAFFAFSTKWLYFGDNAPGQHSFASALDIVGHEFTHGVNYFTCNQTYLGESGACNEAFSDIMAVSAEWFLEPEGAGYNKAEWWQGEDINVPFAPGRDLTNPAAYKIFSNMSWKYPDHYSKKYNWPNTSSWDLGGVHVNMTIVTHWYYLLAAGGTNRTSGLSVSGIGVGDAQKIAYRGWTVYAGPGSGMKAMRSATTQAAVDLFGGGSTQAQRVAQAWDAVGIF